MSKSLEDLKNRFRVRLAEGRALVEGKPGEAWKVLNELDEVFRGLRDSLWGEDVSWHRFGLEQEFGVSVREAVERAAFEFEKEVVRHVVNGEPERAQSTAAQAPRAVIGLLRNPSKPLRRVVIGCLAAAREFAALDEHLEVEGERELCEAIVEAFIRADFAPTADRFHATVRRFPPLRSRLLLARMSASAGAIEEACRTPDVRVEAIRRLGSLNRAEQTRLRILDEALTQGTEPEKQAALAAVRDGSLVQLVGVLRELAEVREDALEVLCALSAVETPRLVLDLVLRNARRTPPVLAGFVQLLGSPHLSSRELADLRALLPVLPDEAAEALRARLARAQPFIPPERLVELEAELDLEPNDSAAWLVWADRAQEMGDPRGELVAQVAAGEDPVSGLLTALPALAPELFGLVDPKDLVPALTLRFGLPVAASFEPQLSTVASQAELIAALMAAPLGRFISKLRLGPTAHDLEENDWSSSIRCLSRFRRVQTLRLEAGHFSWPIEWGPSGDLQALWQLPSLATLEIAALVEELGPIRSESLETLTLRGPVMSQRVVDDLIEMKVPRLRALTIWTGPTSAGSRVRLQDVITLLNRLPPGLRSLGIENCEFAHDLVEVLAQHPVVARLESLSLKHGVLSAIDVDDFLESDRFRHLKVLSLEDNQFDLASVRRLELALPNVSVDGQRDPRPGRRVSY